MNTTGPVIRARYLETEEHLLAAWDRNPGKPRLWIILLIALPLAGLLTLPGSFRDRAKGDKVWWSGPAAFLVVSTLAAWWISPAGQRRQIRKSLRKLLVTPPTEAWYEFSEAGFLSTGQGGKSAFHPWATVPKVLQLSDGLLVYFDQNSYYWVPKQAFASTEDYGIVVKLAQTKVKLFQLATG